MAYQKCPVCNGTGKRIDTLSHSGYTKCNTCKGHGVIDELSGKPPLNDDTDINSGINGRGETQQEYFNK